MLKILCYGDSNTWGYVPNVNGYSKNAIMEKYNQEDCWWYGLKEDNDLFVDGLCGRCIAHENKWLEGRNAQKTIIQDLKKYNNLDFVIVQLGTNDCKNEYNDSAQTITNNLEKLLKTIECITNAKIIIISPAIIQEDNEITKKFYVGANNKSFELDKLFENLALKNCYGFISGKDLNVGEDGEHLTQLGHGQLKDKILKNIINM